MIFFIVLFISTRLFGAIRERVKAIYLLFKKNTKKAGKACFWGHNSWSFPMQILSRLLTKVDEKLGQGTADHFLSVFLQTEFGEQIIASCHATMPRAELSPFFEGLDIVEKKQLEFFFTPTLYKYESVKELFKVFCLSTAHTNIVGDLRLHVPQLYQIYLGPRYFAFHGDGNCVLLGLIFQALAERNGFAVDLRYTSTKERDFMHVFGYAYKNNVWYYLVDPDQKNFFCLDRGSLVPYPSAMIFQLIAFAGALIAFDIEGCKKKWLLSSMTLEYLRIFYKKNKPLIYQSFPSQDKITAAFAKSRAQFEVELLLSSSDYKWKKTLIDIAHPQKPLLGCVDKTVSVLLPVKSNIRIGYSVDDPVELLDLMSIYYGRVPWALTMNTDQEGRVIFELPEVPWLIKLPGDCSTVSINGKIINTHEVASKEHRLIGAGDLELLNLHYLSGKNLRLDLKLKLNSRVTVYLPLNYWALSSGYIQPRLENYCDSPLVVDRK